MKLTFIITDLCNMSCPWCIGLQDMSYSNRDFIRLWDNKVKQLAYSYIGDKRFTAFTVMGGEALLFPNEVKELITTIRNIRGNSIPIQLATNGSLLTDNLCQFLNENNVNVIVSVNTEGYKSIDNLIKLSIEPDIIQTIKNLNHCFIKIVVEYKQLFGKGCLELYDIFKKPIHLCPEVYSCKQWELDDIQLWDKELLILDTNSVPYTVNYAKNYCSCANNELKLYPNGIFGTNSSFPLGGSYGCNTLMNFMKPKLYNQWGVVIQNHTKEKSNVTRCNGFKCTHSL